MFKIHNNTLVGSAALWSVVTYAFLQKPYLYDSNDHWRRKALSPRGLDLPLGALGLQLALILLRKSNMTSPHYPAPFELKLTCLNL